MRDYLLNFQIFEALMEQLNAYKTNSLKNILLIIKSKVDNLLEDMKKEDEDEELAMYQREEVFQIINGC